MPRRKAASATTAAASSQKHKRQTSSTDTRHTGASVTPTRSSKRIKLSANDSPSTSQTPKKSPYFEGSDDNENDQDATSNAQTDDSGYEDEDASLTQSATSESEDEEYNSEEEAKPVKRGRKSGLTSKNEQHQTQGKTDLWREGVKTGLGPGKAVYIERPKARGDGGIPYVPERIHPNTFEFLKDLKKNNDRIWLKAHDPDFRTSWKDFESFVEALTEKIAEIDETIPELPPKDVVFRIYRDVRFSSDPTPYKPHFSAAWSRTGRKGPYACYYVHVQPGEKCFVGGGLWHPDAEPIRLLRADIDTRPEHLQGVLLNPDIRKSILGGIPKDGKKAVKAFCKQNAENALKTKPKGFDADHVNIELLRLRNYTIGQKLTDKEFLSPNGLDKVLSVIRTMYPFITYLNSVVMPDEAAAAEDSSSESSDQQSA